MPGVSVDLVIVGAFQTAASEYTITGFCLHRSPREVSKTATSEYTVSLFSAQVAQGAFQPAASEYAATSEYTATSECTSAVSCKGRPGSVPNCHF